MTFICKAKFINDLTQSFVAMYQAVLDKGLPVLCDVSLQGSAGMLFKILAQIIDGYIELLAQMLSTYLSGW